MWRAFIRTPGAVVGLMILAVVVAVAIIAPALWSDAADTQDFAAPGQGPSAEHWLGTDLAGRDILLRVLVASQLTLVLAVLATLMGAVIGFPTGALAAALPGRVRTVVLRILDALLSFPAILVAIFVGAILGAGPVGAVIGVGAATAISFARLSSTLSLAIGGRDYIQAARGFGIGRARLTSRYILPNIGETLANSVAFTLSSSIIAISSLSFLGLGTQIPAYDWGSLLTSGIQSIFISPLAAVAPAFAIALTSIGFGLLGDAIARSLNPRLWTADRSKAAKAQQLLDASELEARPEDALDLVGDEVLVVRNLHVSVPIGRRDMTIVDRISFALRRGERVGIVGESGSGKTTTALAIAQLPKHPSKVTGDILLGGQDIVAMPRGAARDKYLATHMGQVYQDPMSSLNPPLRIGTQLTEPPRIHRRFGRKAARALAMERMKEVDMPSQERSMRRYPHEFSGGMRQRVMIAMGLINEPIVLIADEPTTALDVTVQAQVMDVLAEVNRNHGTAVILITHNIALVSQNCDRILVMYAGRIVEDGTAEQLLTNASHPYTRALIASVPDTSRDRAQLLEFVPGSPPEVGKRMVGCSYRPRCPLAMEICAEKDPALLFLPDGRRAACWAAFGVDSPRLGAVEEVAS